ncbi:hypothetical protein CROQUDRAFT_667186, partial [Cronartium quercuum f. sp. fusiforme G11]
FLIQEFVGKLAHHRNRALPHLRVSFYLCTSTLQSKFPLPERLPLAKDFTTSLFHDALFFYPLGSYLLSIISICDQLEGIEQGA